MSKALELDTRKPLLTIDEQIAHMKGKGITFNLQSEEDARAYLNECNNYFRLRAYRSSYDKDGMGRYVGLDFAMLRDLSAIDTRLRYEMFKVCVEAEHFSKVSFIKEMSENGDDPYDVVNRFLDEEFVGRDNRVHTRRRGVLSEIERGLHGFYTNDLIASRPNRDYPIWAFVELITLGRFCELWNWYWDGCRDDERLARRYRMLKSVKGLRNACAHNNCIINDMKFHALAGEENARRPRPSLETPNEVKVAVGRLGTIGADRRRRKLGNPRLSQITTALCLHHEIVSPGTREERTASLHSFKDRMEEHIGYYQNNDLIKSGFEYIGALIDGWYPVTT